MEGDKNPKKQRQGVWHLPCMGHSENERLNLLSRMVIVQITAVVLPPPRATNLHSMKSIRSFSKVSLLLLIIGLTSCGGGLDLAKWSERECYRDLERSLAEPDRPELQPLEGLLKQAIKISSKKPGEALDLYLEVAERTLKMSTANGDEALIYRHAIGHAVALMHRGQRQPPVKSSRYRVSYAKGVNVLDPHEFDSIRFADTSDVENIDVIEQDGVGAPMICHIKFSEDNKKAHPYMHRNGINTTATALIEFPSKGQARVTLCNTRRSDRAYFQGSKRRLATNFTTPIVSAALHQQTKRLGWKGIRNPAQFIDEMGLYSIEIIDPTKIPVIFIHGLGSKPSTWAIPYNALLGEKWFRENCQFYGFYYPSGLPPVYPAAGLRQDLAELHRELQRRGAGRNAGRMVLVGHSMGGLITSFQIRDFRGTSDQLFKTPIKELAISDRSRKAMATMLEDAPPRFVKRAVFIATPHRGSRLANNWLGRFVSNLAKVPRDLLTLQIPGVARSLTKLGRDLSGGVDPLNGVARLKTGNPLLSFALDQPIAYGIPYHSIIGDQGEGGGKNRGDKPESSDGVVPYWSSHLEGAASELIVPAHHSAHIHPEAIAELKRILHLHLSN